MPARRRSAAAIAIPAGQTRRDRQASARLTGQPERRHCRRRQFDSRRSLARARERCRDRPAGRPPPRSSSCFASMSTAGRRARRSGSVRRVEENARDGRGGDAQADCRRQHPAGREHRFELTLFLPNRARGPGAAVPAPQQPAGHQYGSDTPGEVRLLAGEQVISRGFGIAALQVGELAPDDKDLSDGALFETTEGAADGAGALAAWGRR